MARKEDEENKEEIKPSFLKDKKKPIIIGASALVLLILVGLGAYFWGSSSSPDEMAPPPPAESTAANPVASQIKDSPRTTMGANQIGPMVNVDEFIVNLLDIDMPRYLKAGLTLELDREETAEEVKTRMPQVRDAILLLAGNKNFSELRDLQGKMQLRAELIGHLNTLLTKGQVKKIYFTNFVIQ